MLNKTLKFSLRTQLTLIIFFVSLFTIVTISMLLVYWKVNETQEHTSELSHTVATILSQDAVQVLLLNSADAASDMASKLESFQSITHAVFFDNSNNPLVAYKKRGEKSLELEFMPVDTVIKQTNFLTVYVPLQFQSTYFGTAAFRIKTDTFAASLLSLFEKEILLIPILILLSYLLSILLNKTLTNPIERIANVFRQYDKTEHPELIEDNYSTMEMNQLANSYNHMIATIRTVKDDLVSQKQRLHVTLDAIADGVIATDINGKITYMNPSAEHICGWNAEESHGKPLEAIYRLIDKDKNEPVIGELGNTLEHGTIQYGMDNLGLQERKGTLIDVQSIMSPIRDTDTSISGAVIIFQNITETRQLYQQLRHQATHDPLTELVNRSELERLLQSRLDANKNAPSGSMLYLDLDQFKVVNDTSGHIAGDSLLKQIASILLHNVKEHDTVARLGGDEFAILLPSSDLTQAHKIAENIRKEISGFSFTWQDSHFRIGVSIGLVPLNQPDITRTDVLSYADMACYAAKDGGRNRIHVYSPEDKDLQHRRGEMQWITQISNALEENRLFLFAQKVIPLNPKNKSMHLEILVRHLDSDGTLRTPGAFIPAIERYGMASEFDRWIIKKALEDEDLLSYLKSSPHHRVNINLSGLTLGDKDLTEFISNLLTKAQLPPRTVCFEITETAAVANLNATRTLIRNLKLFGCDFALDDFGSGVSSFAYLKNLPVDFIKIDGALVRDIDQNPINEAMVNAIHQIGQVMKMKTVAEFVENKNIQDKLISIGVDYAQGYYIHIPAPLQDVVKDDSMVSLNDNQLH